MTPVLPLAEPLGDGSQLWEELYGSMGYHRERDAEVGEVRPAAVNPLRNPSAETNLTAFNLSKISWAAGEMQRAALPLGFGVGDFGVHVTATKDATTTGRTLSVSQSTLAGTVEPGDHWSLGIPVWVLDAFANGLACRIDWYTATPTYISSSPTSAVFAGTGEGFVKLEDQVAPPGASLATVVLAGTTAVNGDTVNFWTDAWQFNEGDVVLDYIDGDQPGCSWSGVAHGSPSIRAAVDTTYPLQRAWEGISAPLQLAHDLSRDRDDQPAPFAVLFDPDECPAELLPYSVQYVGVEITPEMTEAQIRAEFRAPSGWNRGQLQAIKLAGQRTLTGTKRVIVRSRTPEDGHHYIRTLKSETPYPELTHARFRAAVPAWEALDYEAIDGVFWADIEAAFTDYAALKAAFTDYADLADTLPSELPEP